MAECLLAGFSAVAPESPRWLATQGKTEEAIEASNKVRAALIAAAASWVHHHFQLWTWLWSELLLLSTGGPTQLGQEDVLA